MTDTPFDVTQTRLISSHLSRMDDQNGYLVRIHPVVAGEGVVTLPKEDVVIGREEGCDLVLQDSDVSRRHACVEFGDGQYSIRDLGSTNGTLVNGRKVSKAALASGDLVRVGKVILKFLRGGDVEKQYHETLYSMMIQDGLTGIPNKRFLQEALKRELTRSQRHRRPLSLAVFDIDHFKAVNDRFGHLSGDAVLRELASRVKAAIRGDEVFARYGGEEFVVLLPESGLEQAVQFAERVRMLVAAEPFEVEGARIPVSVSIGVAHTLGESGVSPEELVGRADRKLYEAKAAGRNRVVS
jgi:diguanylate cyclase (GGDEF)-like protein